MPGFENMLNVCPLCRSTIEHGRHMGWRRGRWLLPLALTCVLSAQSPSGWIVGWVHDTTGAPLHGAQVYLPTIGVGALSDSTGYFRIGPIPVGSYELIAQYIGYEEAHIPDITVSTGEPQEANIVMISTTVLLEEIYVVPKPKGFSSEGVTALLTRRMIEESPGAAQDIFLVLQTLPGVSSMGDDSKLYVRGGKPDENLVIYDGVTIRSPFHFDFIGGGFYSIFNTALVENVTLFSGGFPARYGDRLSAVLVIENREGSRDRLGSEFSLSMSDFSGLVEFPIGNAGSSIFSLRRSYFDLLLNLTGFGSAKQTILPFFYDFNGKVDLNLTSRHRLSLNTLYSVENSSMYFDEPHWTGVHSTELRSATLGTRLRSLWSQNLSSEVDIYWAQSNRRASHADDAARERVDESEVALKADVAYFGLAHEVHAGLWIVGDQSDLRIFYPVEIALNFEPVDLNGKGKTSKYAAYIEDTYAVSSQDELNLGLRFDAVGTSGEMVLAPRLGWVHHLRSNVSASVLFGLYTQAPAAYELDTNPNLESKRALSSGIGLSGGDPTTFMWSVEAYYKKLDRLVTVSPDGLLASDGTGNVRGLEAYLQYHDSQERFTGWLSLTLSRAVRQEGTATEQVLFDYDQPVLFSTVGHYRLGEFTTVGYRFRYGSGRPYTPAEGGFYSAEYDRWFPIVGERNSERYPAYHRLDLRLSRTFPRVKNGLTVYLETINTYNHNNVAFFQWNEQFDDWDEFTIFPFLPVLGIELGL